jgi:hypothetical protein
MDIVTAPQCDKCSAWKVPHFTEAITAFDEAPKWAVIWYCPKDNCHEYSTPQANTQESLF